MSGPSSSRYWQRRPQISACREGRNLILYDPDTAREKVINSSGTMIWNALNGGKSEEELAVDLARQYEQPSAPEILADTQAFLAELARDGFAAASPAPSHPPLPPESYSWIHEAPRSFDLSLTGRCNLRCQYCFYAEEMAGRADLPAERWLAFFRELRELAARQVTLSGGELFLRPDLWELLDAIIAARLRFTLLTNGTLITETVVARLCQERLRSRLDSIQVSLDGSRAEIHDAVRGPGSFDRALRGLRLLREAALPATVRVTVNRNNVTDLENIARLLLEEIGLPRFGTNDALPLGSGCAHCDEVVLTPEQRAAAMHTWARLEEKYPGRIHATAGSQALRHIFREMETARQTGIKTRRWQMGSLSSCGCMFAKLAVLHDGTIVPCNMLPAAVLGRIGETPIRNLWRNHPLLQEMRSRSEIPMEEVPGCGACEWAPYCNGGCPAVVYTRTGDLYRANPDCCYRLFRRNGGTLP